MTNKQLLNKMKELKIEVKSHMSSLEDSTVAAIKREMFGKKKQKSVKVRPSVIRRRKAKPDLDDQTPDVEDEAGIDEGEDAVEETEAPAAVVRRRAAAPVEETPEEDPAPAAPEAEAEAEEEKAAVVKKRPARKVADKTAEPAKIIRPVATEPPKPEPEPEPEVEATPQPEEEAPVTEDKKDPETVDTDAVATAVEDAPEQDAPVQPVDADTPAAEEKAAPEETPAAEAPAEAEDAPAVKEEDKAQAKKKKKKKKSSTPAKIVRVADPAVLENIRRMKQPAEDRSQGGRGDAPARQNRPNRPSRPAAGPGPNVPVQDMMMPPQPGADPRKKGWGGADQPGKRKRRKKKSVVEGNDLYRNRGRKKKGRKDVRGKKGAFQKTQITTPKAIKRRIKIDEAIELSELAKRMGIKANEMIVKLMGMGVMATVNQTIDFDTASLVAAEFDFEVEKASFEEEALLGAVETEVEDDGNMEECPPVVTIMGHVDHGKTSLLDVIRESKITSGEAGGITQHIGAYNVETAAGGRITFLDTPGHAAFTAMRSRGARVTDIVILVVAADDGVMPQTIEAINHAKAADVPVVVAVNKMDKAGADPDRIMRELSEHDLLAEDWGGSVIFVKVSAKTGEGIDDLLEMVLLQAEVLELRANPDRKATGYVVESRLDTGRGSVATVLVKQGTLKDGDPIVCGLHSGRIRAMIDDTGSRIESAGPSMPVEIVGMTGVPDAGDEFIAVASDKDAKQIAGHRMQKQRAKELAKKSRANLEKMFENLGSAEIKELKLIVKADVQGSIEALNDSLKDLAKEEVDVKIVHSGAGTINESDVALAGVSDAIIIGFNVRPSPQIRKLAKDENVDMRFYDIIYDVIND
ncbi:MAG: translation initiation factor IF-2, partial [Desulfobacterales bacterium]|nr:translation initiation factor IF-2 [Desulfobacterales bacterium]